jgi:NAD(P)-dependent dehydrogenase (short-subunit alcohol dehydrogenase family)
MLRIRRAAERGTVEGSVSVLKTILITGADRGLGLSLCKEYLNRGWRVFAGKFMADYTLLEDTAAIHPHLHIQWLDVSKEESITEAARWVQDTAGNLDMLISNAALMGRTKCELYDPPMEVENAWISFRVNALGPLLLTEKLLPLMAGGMKRLCYVSSEVACISLMKFRADEPFPYSMSKAGMQMGVRMMFNDLYGKGFTFRLFHPGWMKFRNADGTLSERALFDPDDIGRVAARYFDADLYDEHRLVMVDYNGYEWPY